MFCLDVQAQSAQENEAGVLEEVIVTAQRRETNLQRTGLAATVLSGQELAAKGVTDLVDIQYVAPSVNISDFGSANVFNIRGIGRSKVDIEIPSGVVIYSDGVPSIAGYFQNEPYYDIAAVEVLRGPQGTFVGKSASGGAVFVRTRDPEIDAFGGMFEAGLGEHNLWEGRGVLNTPVSDTLAFRFAFNYQNRDDYYDRIYGPYTGDPATQDLLSFRAGMLWQPSEQMTVKFKANFADLDFGGNVASSYGDPLYDVHQDAPFVYKDESTRLVLEIEYELAGGTTFKSLSGYQELDTINNLDLNASIQTPTYWFKSSGMIDLWSQEFNLISDEDQRLRWVTGLFLQNQKNELPPVDQFGFTFIGGDPFGIGQLPLDYPWLGSPWIKDEDDWAVFGHIAYDLTEALELEVGARYSDYEFYQVTDYVFGFGDAPPALSFPNPADPGAKRQDFSEDSVDWKLALNWTRDERNFLYGVISRGHTTGSVNIFPPYEPYGEMEVMNYEGGWKSSFNDDQFVTQLALYYENIDDYQAAFDTLLTPPNTAGQVKSAESDSTIYGLELTGQATFDMLKLDFGISWNESELGTFRDVLHPLSGEVIDLSGAPFPYAPDFTANIGMEYRFDFANGSTLSPRFDYGYITDSKADLYTDPEFDLESRGLLNVNIRWEKGPWHAVLWASNLTDEKYVAAIQNQGALYYAGPRRQSGIRVGYSF
ncbi:MAG: TonB-dependent receptor [Lysobacterales bacterium]